MREKSWKVLALLLALLFALNAAGGALAVGVQPSGTEPFGWDQSVQLASGATGDDELGKAGWAVTRIRCASSASVYQGSTLTFKATYSPSSAYRDAKLWYVNGLKLISARITSRGKATIQLRAEGAPGTYYIGLGSSSRNAVLKKVKITIKPAKVSRVSLNATSRTMVAGEKFQLSASVSPSYAGDKRVTWSSSKKSVATVDASGRVTAKKPGKATITVKSRSGGKKAKCIITVKPVAVQSVRLSQTTLGLAYRKSARLTATVLPANATNKQVTWKSSNRSVATVSSKGKVTAKGKAGTAVITVTTKDGRKVASCTVLVSKTGATPAPTKTPTPTRTPAPTPTKTPVTKKPVYRALLIGNEHYSRTLNGPIQDVKNMISTLKLTSHNGVKYSKIMYGLDMSARGMMNALEQVPTWGVTENDVTLFYYSGHGYQNNSSESGTGIVGVDSVGLSMSQLQALLSKIPGKVIVVLDSCFSGKIIGKGSEASMTSISAEALANYNQSVVDAFSSVQSKALSGSKYQVITASRGNETSQSLGMRDSAGNVRWFGLATYYVALAGGYEYFDNASVALVADTNKNKIVTLHEAFTFAAAGVEEMRVRLNNQNGYRPGNPNYITQAMQVYPVNSNYPLFARN